ncbi:MAG TPA: 4-(cytidine 5'-diphospho)-2-C-methyl-D-erythritol kinase [Planctomycetota bacterium]|nr:4-(cytidine 5'-diphospho)-2-C-methyl-D-erythritol kinase [Planctomycetota bacterium]
MELKAYAKINWDLHILGKRPDGFHELDSVFVNVSLHDTLQLEPASEICFECSDPSLPTDDSNLVVKAAKLLAKAAAIDKGAFIRLSKNIPAGGGMGGGSSDAASTLLGLNKLWGLDWPIERLEPLAAELGSDVTFFLHGGWRHCCGRGEIVKAIPDAQTLPSVSLLLVLPSLHVSTPAVYKQLNAPVWDGKSGKRSLTEFSHQLKLFLDSKKREHLGLRNDLTLAAKRVEPRLEHVQKVLEAAYPGRWLMSGSGAVHFIITSADDDGSSLRKMFTQQTPRVRVITATTVAP